VFYLNVSLNISFRELVKKLKWLNLYDFSVSEDSRVVEDLKTFLEARRLLNEKVRGLKGFKDRLGRIGPKELEEASRLLSQGRVFGVDGTISLYPTPLGVKCRIGVVCACYGSERFEEAVYVSDTMFIDEGLKEDVVGFLEKAEEFQRFSRLFYNALMLYKERSVALECKGDYVMVQGPLVPLELRIGRLGVEGFLEASLELARRVIESKKIVGVLSTTSHLRFLNIGMLLKPGEYLKLTTLDKIVENEARRLMAEEKSIVEEFAKDYASQVIVGVYRVSSKPYVFEAHKEVFDKAASIIIADSIPNRVHGFPLLLAYVDTLCRNLFPSKAFTERIESILLRLEGEKAFMYFDERRLRPS